MGLDYALVHLYFTIPPAVVLTLFYWPLFSKRDFYRICLLISIAVLSTIPWDSYLIRSKIWSYPRDAVLGPTAFNIPIEEIFFFVIQTYDVSLLYIILSKPTFYPAYLPLNFSNGPGGSSTAKGRVREYYGAIVQIVLGATASFGFWLVYNGGTGTYLGLILAWATPFFLFIWTLSQDFILSIPAANVLLPIALPTAFLWLVDTVSLHRGTWVINSGTKCNIFIWPNLEIEEGVFFLFTNVLIVMGQIAFDHAVAVLDLFSDHFAADTHLPSLSTAISALLMTPNAQDEQRIISISEASERLRKKSRSFYIASSVFEGKLRHDLVLLYSFCRVADDLVDGAKNAPEARDWITRLRTYLDLAYPSKHSKASDNRLRHFVETMFPHNTQHAFTQLPISRLSKEPLYGLLKGFELDLQFAGTLGGIEGWPIGKEEDLAQYGLHVAGTVAELCIDLCLSHATISVDAKRAESLKGAGRKMGIALQTVNIARDIAVDAALGRVYIPASWLEAEGLTPEDILHQPSGPPVSKLRSKLLELAFRYYDESRPAIEELPLYARGPMRVAVESYMEIGRVLQQERYQVQAGRATVPIWRRLKVARQALGR